MERLVLSYIRDCVETEFPVADLEHAISLADNIAVSDEMNTDIDFSCLELYVYNDMMPGVYCYEPWESECGDTFEEVWRQRKERGSNA